MKQLLTLLLVLLINISAMAQTQGDTLDLSTKDQPKLVGHQNYKQEKDSVFIAEESISISKLVFNLENSDSVFIKINGNLIQGGWKVKNFLGKEDKLTPIKVKDGDCLSIEIGTGINKRIETLNIKKEVQMPIDDGTGEQNEENANNWNFAITGIAGIILGIILSLLGIKCFTYVLNKKKKNKKVNEIKDKDSNVTNETEYREELQQTVVEQQQQPLPPSIAWDDIRREHMDLFTEGKSEEDWKKTLLEKLKKCKEFEKEFADITILLTNRPETTLQQKIEALKQDAEKGLITISEEPEQIDVKAEVSKELTTLFEDKLGRSSDKEIKDAWNKAKQEKKEPKEQLAKFVSLVESSLRNKNQGTTSAVPDFKSQLNDSNNRAELKSWFVKQLRLKGIEVKNPNALLDNIVEELKQRLDNANNTPAIDDNEIALKLTREDKLPQETITAIIKKLVAALNDKIDNKLGDYTKVDTLADDLAAKLNVPNDFDEAVEKGKRELISKFKGLNLENPDDLAEIIDAVNEAVEDSNSLQPIFKQYGIDKVDGLVAKIRQKEADDIKSKLNDEELAKCESVEQIMNALSKQKEEALENAKKAEADKKEYEELIVGKLKKGYADVDPSGTVEGDSALEVFDKYQEKVKQNIDAKTSELAAASEKITKYENDLSAKETKINEQTEIIDAARNRIKEIFNADMRSLKDSIEDVHIMKECDKDSKEVCPENERVLQDALKDFLDKAKLSDTPETKPSALYDEAKQVILNELAKDNGLFDIIAKYHAYSMLPFMTDKTREYGVRLERANISMMYDAISKLTNDFGIQLIVPVLFAEKVSDGEYEDCTGSAYNDLDNLCPNSGNYKDNISSSDKANIIVDLVKVGYRMNDKVTKSKVLV